MFQWVRYDLWIQAVKLQLLKRRIISGPAWFGSLPRILLASILLFSKHLYLILDGSKVRPVYTSNFWCNFCRDFQCNLCRVRSAISNHTCKPPATSMHFQREKNCNWFRTCSKPDATCCRFFRKMCMQKGSVPVRHFSARTVDYKLTRRAITAKKKKKSCLEQFGASKRKNKTKKIIVTHYVTLPPFQCYTCVYRPCEHALLATLLLKSTTFYINCNDIALKLRWNCTGCRKFAHAISLRWRWINQDIHQATNARRWIYMYWAFHRHWAEENSNAIFYL